MDSIQRTGSVYPSVQTGAQAPGSAPENRAGVSTASGLAVRQDDGASPTIKSSVDGDSVGRLATELANSRTNLEVQHVLSKAMLSLAQLKAAAANSQGDDLKRVRALIARTEKLVKRSRTKLRQLGQEQNMERRRARAEKARQQEEARQLREEVNRRRSKRQKEESRYAAQEVARDQENSLSQSQAVPFGGSLPVLPAGAGGAALGIDPSLAAAPSGVDAAPAAPVLDISV